MDDGTITCAEPAGTGSGTGTGGGGGGACENPTCDGPCCAAEELAANCAFDCTESVCNPMSPDFNPMDPSACFNCIDDCDRFYLEDPACEGPFRTLLSCEEATGCDDQFDPFDDDDQYDACVTAACCDEFRAAF